MRIFEEDVRQECLTHGGFDSRGGDMAATLIGTVGIWGISSAETTLGIIIENIDETSKSEKNPIKNNIGERTGRSDYDESIDVKVKGKLTSSTPYSGKLSANIVLSNAITANHLQTANTGRTLVNEVRRGAQNEDWKSIEIDVEVLPFFT